MTDAVYYDQYDRSIRVDPYPVWRRMRDEVPLYYNGKYDFYAVTRFDDVREVLVNWEIYSSKYGTVLEIINAGVENLPNLIPINYDPPKHTEYRAVLGKAFTPRRINKLEAEIRALTCEYLDAHAGSGGFEFADVIAKRLPAHVLGMLLGVPEQDRNYLRELAEALLHRDEGEEDWNFDAQKKIAEYLIEHTRLRRKQPAEDLTTTVVEAEINDAETGERRKLSEHEALGYLSLVIGAGNDTTANLLTWLAYCLAQFPAERQKLHADPGIIPNAVEETLRYQAPSPQQFRVTLSEVELHGRKIAEGARILVINGAANRDERIFNEPDVYAVDRKILQTMTFGQGAHNCLGAALSRLEGRIVLEEMLRRFPNWGIDLERSEMKHTSTVRGWNRLPIVF